MKLREEVRQMRKNVEQFEKEQIEQVLRTHNGHMYKTAQALGVPERWLYRAVKRLDIQASAFRTA